MGLYFENVSTLHNSLVETHLWIQSEHYQFLFPVQLKSVTQYWILNLGFRIRPIQLHYCWAPWWCYATWTCTTTPRRSRIQFSPSSRRVKRWPETSAVDQSAPNLRMQSLKKWKRCKNLEGWMIWRGSGVCAVTRNKKSGDEKIWF